MTHQNEALEELLGAINKVFLASKGVVPAEVKEEAQKASISLEFAILMFFEFRTYSIAKGYNDKQVDSLTTYLAEAYKAYGEQLYGIDNARMAEILETRINTYNNVFARSEDQGRWKMVGLEALAYMKIDLHEKNIRPLKECDTQIVPEPEEKISVALKTAINKFVSLNYSKIGLCGILEKELFAGKYAHELFE
ncbi:MAG: hypothetical protein MJ239_02370 [Bacilli bacterium]|nr:hypothetical protein [Bacilli bacterium]